MIKLIHTSDIHLGAYSLGVKNSDAQDVIKRTFKKITELCVEKKVDFLIVAGDLFNSNEPSHSAVEFLKERLRYLNGKNIKVIISPGNHDNLGKNSVYFREDLARDLENVYIFNDAENFIKEFPDFDLAIISKPCFSHDSNENLFRSIFRSNKKYNLAVVHGSSSRKKGGEDNYYPFDPEDVVGSGMDYIALGHYHSFRDESAGGVTAIYSGSPEPLSISQKEAGSIIYVEMDGGVKFERVWVSEKRFDEIMVQMDNMSDIGDLKNVILKGADKNLARTANLVGFAKLDLAIIPKNLEEELNENFSRLKIVDKTKVQIFDEDLAKYPKEMVIGQFVSLVKQKIDSVESEEEKSFYGEILKLGIAELEGKNIINDLVK